MGKRKTMFEEAMPAEERLRKRPRNSERNGKAPKAEGAGDTDPLLALHLTDTGNGQRLVHLHGADLRFCHPWKKWLCWDGQRWREDDQGRPELLAKVVCRELLKRASGRLAELAKRLQSASPDEESAIGCDGCPGPIRTDHSDLAQRAEFRSVAAQLLKWNHRPENRQAARTSTRRLPHPALSHSL